ncbi:hypothetical protein CHUAL_008106 [Chamberlinius hualienensis]
MAECVVARCVQERRFLKREFQKWSKNVLFLEGLERVAQEMMGNERWTKVYQPQTELESKEVVDWNPDDKCYFCNNWKTPYLDSNNATTNGSTLVDDYLSDQEQGTFSRGVSRSASPASVDSDKPLDLSIGSRTRCHTPNGLLIDGEVNGSSVAALLKVPHIPDKSGYMKNPKNKKLKRPPARVESSTTTTVCKRSYTEEELQAALQDIRSGKLGTRRAAVIYGIPRSTLRNKVYKLALIGDKNLVQDSASSKIGKLEITSATTPSTGRNKSQTTVIDKDHNFETKNKGTSASESLRRLLRNRISENLENHHIQQSLYETSNSSLLASLESNPALAPILSQVLANVHQLALMSLQGDGSGVTQTGEKDLSANLDLPLLPELIRKLTEKRFEEECNRHRLPTSEIVSPSSKTGENTGNSASSTSASVILKIPSYKPVKSVHNSDANVTSSQVTNNNGNTANNNIASSNGNKVGGATLREIIAKNITQRVNKNKQTVASYLETSTTSNGNLSAKKPRTSAADLPTTISAGTSETGAVGGNGHNLRTTRSSSSSTSNRTAVYDSGKDVKRDKPEKRSRPKRGRYRNYDRDNLVEAVRAVQRGEMSVHRAGSFYGVPHSTLEYKVKERHLLRPRKHRLTVSKSAKGLLSSGKNTSSSSSSCSSSSCSMSSTISSTKTAVTNNAVDEKNKSGAKQQSGTTVSGGDSTVATTSNDDNNRWSNSPLFALDFSRLNSSNFFASQMMRKLQEDALTQGSRTGENLSSRDALLLGVLLRNGLQMAENNSNSK